MSYGGKIHCSDVEIVLCEGVGLSTDPPSCLREIKYGNFVRIPFIPLVSALRLTVWRLFESSTNAHNLTAVPTILLYEFIATAVLLLLLVVVVVVVVLVVVVLLLLLLIH